MTRSFSGTTFRVDKSVGLITRAAIDVPHVTEESCVVVFCEGEPWLARWAAGLAAHFQLPGLAYLGQGRSLLEGDDLAIACDDLGLLIMRLRHEPGAMASLVGGRAADVARIVTEELARPVDRPVIPNASDGDPDARDLIRFLRAHRALLDEVQGTQLCVLQFWS